ncbi:tyrosine-type recombinase/integrase [Umezawaea tangerina]|uniref:Site-specific recombinase XerD n=1 Tax=Umezawaea tangerina TaxID=84725 RepID=A0A2T0SS68_9PSEU|nr:tyrosine-type recombinase/integrase [Umezawaea tangerina]PRY36261.1 site-specific recombinase XerD [Umezawaea tangerina]
MGGNNKGRKRRFGAVRKLPSGRFQARYPGPDGQLRPADKTFRTQTEADDFLDDVRAEIKNGEWIDPEAGRVKLKDYATTWIRERDLGDRTRELYAGYLKNHIGPHLGELVLVEISAPRVRAWRAELIDAKTGASTVAKSYRFLRTVLNTAVDDELIRKNPCRIKGAGQERAPERPHASLAEVFRIAGRIDGRYRLLVLLAAFAQLRFGELVALLRSDLTLPHPRKPTAEEIEAGVDADELIDDGTPTIRVDRALAQLDTGEQKLKAPKSEAGRRTVALPAAILPVLRQHLATPGFADPEPDGKLFRGPRGATPRRNNFNGTWKTAVAKAEANPELHLHDLRHAGATLTAQTGATLKEIMSRIGHSSTRAAMVYQHATSERDREIAAALNALISGAMREAESEGEQDPPV